MKSIISRLTCQAHFAPLESMMTTRPQKTEKNIPLTCDIYSHVIADLSAIRSRWGQRLGQEKAASENSNLQKAKVLEIRRFRGLLVRREGFEPPAFWSVGCLKAKSESFRLRFVLFTAIRSVSFPLFPSSPARFFRILGQNWVKRSPAEYR